MLKAGGTYSNHWV